MRLLDRHLARAFGEALLPTLLLLAGLFSFLALSEQLEDVGKGTFHTADAVSVVALTLPRRTLQILPVAALLATLLGLGALTSHSEIVVMRAVGQSPRRIAEPVALSAVALAAIALVLQSYGIPGWEREAQQRRATALEEGVSGSAEEFWTRSGDRLLRVGNVRYGRIPTEIEIYEFDDRDQLIRVIQAGSADLITRKDWHLRDVRISQVREAAPVVEERPVLVWPSFLSEQQLASLVQPAETLGPVDLYRYIRVLERNRLDSHEFRLVFWQRLALPLGVLAMAVLGVPFVLGSVRTMPIGLRAAMGGGIGIVYYLGEQILGHMALLYRLPPAPVALAPAAALAVMAAWALRRCG